MPDPSTVPVIPRLLLQFEGHSLTVVTIAERPAWLAREVGTAIGYAGDGKRLVSLVTGDWAEEFIEGHDYVFVRGEDLAAIKAVSGVAANAPVALFLFEPGLHLVLTKTNKPIGSRTAGTDPRGTPRRARSRGGLGRR